MPPLVNRTAAALLAAATAVTAQTGCLDQSYVPSPNNGLEVTAAQPVTQTFTAGLGGQLRFVEIALINHHRGQPTVPLNVAIVPTDARGVPSGAPLASLSLPPAAVPTRRGPLLLDLSAFNIPVVPGQVLGIALSSNAGSGAASYAWWGEAPGASYADGQVFIRGTTSLTAWDLAFRTWVAVPASATNYGSGFAGTNGIPTLTSNAVPALGTTPSLRIGNSSPTATLGALFAGPARANQSTPLGGTLLVDLVASITLQLPAGGASVPTPIPNDTTLCGVVVDFQAVMLDSGAALGVAFTPGLEFVLGE